MNFPPTYAQVPSLSGAADPGAPRSQDTSRDTRLCCQSPRQAVMAALAEVRRPLVPLPLWEPAGPRLRAISGTRPPRLLGSLLWAPLNAPRVLGSQAGGHRACSCQLHSCQSSVVGECIPSGRDARELHTLCCRPHAGPSLCRILNDTMGIAESFWGRMRVTTA